MINFSKIKNYTTTHKKTSIFIAIVVIIIGYYTYKKIFPTVTIPQYTISRAHMGSIIQTVTGTGQVSALNQLDITSQVSGQITSIPVSVGQSVSAGDVIAKIDSTDAGIALQNAQVAYAKLTEAAKPTDIANAQNNLTKSYSDAYGVMSDAFIHVPNVMSGLKDLFYGKSGFLSAGNSYNFIQSDKDSIATAGATFDIAANEYDTILAKFQSISKSSSPDDINTMIGETYDFVKQISEAIKDAQAVVTSVSVNLPNLNTAAASSALANLSAWSSQENGDLSSLLSAKNTIASSQTTLQNLQIGADPLDVEAQALSLKQQENTFAKYTIRAPFDGIIGRIPVNVYGQAGASTVMATIIGNQKIAVISLNEVDAAKVAVGQNVNITFDAIDGLNATGTVQEVDQVGAVSSGVVSYGVKILINTSDARIKPGMSVNTTIITQEKDGVLIVPSAAVKTLGKAKYVQVLTPPQNASSTRQYTGAMGSTTGMGGASMGSTTRQFGGQGGAGAGVRGAGITITSTTPPTQVTVTVGDSDDTNTEILSGLNPGQFVVTKTSTTASTNTTTSAPSILGALGGGRGLGGGGGGARPATPAATTGR